MLSLDIMIEKTYKGEFVASNAITIDKILGEKKYLQVLEKRFAKQVHDKSAVDLGCRVPYNLFQIYHSLRFKKLIAVDIKSERDCMISYMEYLNGGVTTDQGKFIKEVHRCKTFWEFYSLTIEPGDDNIAKITSREEFQSIFLTPAFLKTSIQEFLITTNEKFDIIIASNVLHFISDPEEIRLSIRKMKKCLRPEGFIYIVISSRPHLKLSAMDQILKSEFDDGLISTIYNLDETWRNTMYSNIDFEKEA